MRGMKPKSVTPPLPFPLGFEMDHIVGSKTLITELAKPGIKYDEVKWFKQSVAIQSQSKDEENFSSVFPQWVAFNCDHNGNTLDEKGVFHLMEIIELLNLLRG